MLARSVKYLVLSFWLLQQQLCLKGTVSMYLRSFTCDITIILWASFVCLSRGFLFHIDFEYARPTAGGEQHTRSLHVCLEQQAAT
jgi:hypothetical protein